MRILVSKSHVSAGCPLARLTVAAGVAAALLLAAPGEEVYRVDASVPSGGIDLMGGGYATDKLYGPSSAIWVGVTGTVTHAAGLTAAHPFEITNLAKNAKLTFKNSGLLGSVPLRVVGPGSGTVYFDGDTLNVDETTDASILSWRNINLQIDNLTVSSKTGPAAWHITNATFYVRRDTYIGRDGGTGTVVTTQGGLGRSNSAEEPGLGARGTCNIYLGASSAQGLGISSGTLQIKGGTASAWHVYFGSANVADPGDGSGGTPNLLQMDGGAITVLYFHKAGALPAKIAFNGGQLRSHGWGTFFAFNANTSGDLILEGQNGRAIDIYFNKFAPFVSWGSGATGRLVFRGDSDVYLYGGDYNSGHTYAQQCFDGAQFSNRADGKGYVWEQTGDLYFKPSAASVVSRCLIQSNDILPHGPANGGVVVLTNPKLFTVDLMGTTQSCNSLFGGGLVTNTSASVATLNIGENGNDCVFDVQLCGGTAVNVNKLGAGEIVVAKPVTGTFTVEGGCVALTNAAGAVTFGGLVLNEGTRLVLRGGLYAPSADFDLSSSGTGDIEIREGGVLRVGGSSDVTLDLSRVSGDVSGVIEKVGTGTLTLTGESSFCGILRVNAGTVAAAAGASLGALASIEVAADATLDLASGVALNAYALRVRGVDGTVNTRYSGTDPDSQTLAGLTGAGTVAVVARTALWTGAVDDDATKVGNWQGLLVAPDVRGGSFSPVFAAASDNGGAMDVGVGYAFNGLSFTADVTSFTLRAAGAGASLGLGAGGLTFPSDATTREVTFDTSVAIAPGNQIWNLPNAGTSLNVNGPLADSALVGVATVRTEGMGKIYFRSTNSTYTGSVVITNDQAYAYGDEPFGPSNATGTARLEIGSRNGTRLMLSNTKISKPVRLVLNGGGGGRQTYGFAANTTNVFYGLVSSSIGSGVDAFSLPASSTVVFAGGYGTSDYRFYVNWGAEGMVVISNKPLYATTWECGAKKLRLHCPGNVYNSMSSWSNNANVDYNPYNPCPLSVDFRCDWGFDLPTSKTCMSGTWDLHGHPQRVGAFYSNGTIQSFDGPATFYVNQHKWSGSYPYVNGKFPNTAYPIPPSSCQVKGEVSIYKTGALPFGFTNRVVAATGTVTVAEGPFTLWAGATWAGATNVVVTGGTLRLTQSNQLSPEADYHLSGGALELDAGTTQKARYLWLGGAETPIKRGVWGALDNLSVPAANRTALITGGGTLLVRGDGKGLAFVLR